MLEAFYRRLVAAPLDWLHSPAGRSLTARAYRHIRQRVGPQAARELRNRLTVAWAAAAAYECRGCSTGIRFGTYCRECRADY